MILVNNTLVQGQHDFYKRVGIVLPEGDSENEQNEEQNPVLNPSENPGGGQNENPENPVLDPGENSTPNSEEGGGK